MARKNRHHNKAETLDFSENTSKITAESRKSEKTVLVLTIKIFISHDKKKMSTDYQKFAREENV